MERRDQAIHEERNQHKDHSFVSSIALDRVKDDLKSWELWFENNDDIKADQTAENVKPEGPLPTERFSTGPRGQGSTSEAARNWCHGRWDPKKARHCKSDTLSEPIRQVGSGWIPALQAKSVARRDARQPARTHQKVPGSVSDVPNGSWQRIVISPRLPSI